MHNRFWTAIRLLSVVTASAFLGTGMPGQPFGIGVAAAQEAPDDALSGFMVRATRAVNSRHIDEVAPLAGGVSGAPFDRRPESIEESFAWVPKAHETWEGAALTAWAVPRELLKLKLNPSVEPEMLAVFHAWHSCQSDGDHVYRLVFSSTGWLLGSEIPETETLGFRVRDHDLHVTFDLSGKNATVTDTIQVERTIEKPPLYGLLRISHDFHVQSITTAGATGNKAVQFRQTGGVIAFEPPGDRTFTLTLHYTGHLDNKESDYIRTNEAVLCSYWYPHIARLPARTTVTATVPAGWKAIAQGEVTHQAETADGGTTITFRNEVPNCFYTLDIGRYTITTRKVKEHTLSVYQLTQNPALAQACLDRLAASLDFYEHNFAPFPFTRYAIVETQGAFSGALEAYSFSTYGPHTLPELIPHELSHTWWGGMIPCTYTHSMWDEAFAEYSDDLFTRSRQSAASNAGPPAPSPARLLAERRKEAEAYAGLPLGQAYDTENDGQIAVGYEKGHRVLRMLEAQLGQPLMLRCMRRFFADHPKGEAADWPEFETGVRNETGMDYRWFFAEWIDRPGTPTLALAHTTVHKENDGYLVETDVVQGGTPYRLELPIRVELSVGQPLRVTKEIDGASTHLTFHVASLPTRLRLDPNDEVLFAPPLGTPSTSDPTLYLFKP